MDGYDTVDEAIHDAATAARSQYGNHYEAMLLVYELGGRYYFDPPHTDPNKSGANVRARIVIPKGAKPAALVHNHPAGAGMAEFSQEDVEVAERLKIPSAIIYGRNDPVIRLFRPGASPMRMSRDGGSGRPIRVSDGEPFEWKPPPPVAAPSPSAGLIRPNVSQPMNAQDTIKPRMGLLPAQGN